MKKKLFIIATFILGLLNASCSSNHEVDEKTAANYLNYCAGCHGFQLEKFVKNDWMEGNDNTSIINSISNGIASMGMPAFNQTFTEEELKALAAYVKNGIPAKLDDSYKPQTSPINESEELTFLVDTIVTGLDIPWGLEFLANGDLLIAERKGILYRFDGNELHEVSGLPPILAIGQGGLMDIQKHPDYDTNGWIYISFTDPADEEGEKGGNTSIIRTRIKDFELYDVEKIFNGNPDTDKSYHFGCKLAFDREGYLYFGIGDRGHREFNPQSLSNTNGKMHRIHDDGRIPVDNPFVDDPNAVASIYSYGHRNPQGTAMHPETGEIWESEHGPKGGDELNLIKPGINYGWPVISYGINYNGTTFTDITEKEGMEQPVKYWVPSIAPCGMTFVTGDVFNEWQNNILIGSLKFQNLERLVLENNQVSHREILIDKIGRVRNVKMSPDGYVYVAIEKPGKIVRLVPFETK